MLFVWNGREAQPLVKATALAQGFNLDGLLNSSKDHILRFLFGGGAIREKKLKKGSVLSFSDAFSSSEEEKDSDENPNQPSTDEIVRTFETVYLFQFFMPKESLAQLTGQLKETKMIYPMFSETFLNNEEEAESKPDTYLSRFQFVDMGDSSEEEEEASAPPTTSIPSLQMPRVQEEEKEASSVPKLDLTTPGMKLNLAVLETKKEDRVTPSDSNYEDDFEEDNF